MSTAAAEKRRHIPAELLEKIFLNLPAKSLLRISTVSKPWNRMIMGSEFGKRYRGREMLVLRLHSDDERAPPALVCPLSTLSSSNLNLNLSCPNFAFPLRSEFNLCSQVSCGNLLCFELQTAHTLCLYNPSTRLYRKLPPPSSQPQIGTRIIGSFVSVFAYGLGYDSVSDDYKLLKIHRDFRAEEGAELYSLNTDSWRVIADSWRKMADLFPISPSLISPIGQFAGGSIHWLIRCYAYGMPPTVVILSFRVSTEEFELVAPPPRLPQSVCRVFSLTRDRLDLRVWRGSLCLFMCHRRRLVMWMYSSGSGVWRRDLRIDYSDVYPLRYYYLKPLYFCDSDGKLVRAVTSPADARKIYVYDDKDKCLVERRLGDCGVVGAFSFVETLVSPFPRIMEEEEEET